MATKTDKATVVLTHREWLAIMAAWACYDAVWEDEGDDVPVDFNENQKALARVKEKWYAALDAQEK